MRPLVPAALFVLVLASGAAAYGLVKLAHVLHPLVGDVVSILLIYTCIAARDLAGHGYRNLRSSSHIHTHVLTV